MNMPTQLTDRLNQNVKFNPSLAQKLEEGNGLVADVREYNESVGIAYEGDTTNNEAF